MTLLSDRLRRLPRSHHLRIPFRNSSVRSLQSTHIDLSNYNSPRAHNHRTPRHIRLSRSLSPHTPAGTLRIPRRCHRIYSSLRECIRHTNRHNRPPRRISLRSRVYNSHRLRTDPRNCNSLQQGIAHKWNRNYPVHMLYRSIAVRTR